MMEELKKLRELTEELTGNGYLRDQADEWEYALDAMPEFVFIINTQYVIKFINSALSNAIGVKSKEVLFNKKIFDVLQLDEPFIINSIGTSKQGKEVFLITFNKWFLCYFEPIKASGGIIIGYICFLINITDRKKAEKEAALYAAELNEAINNLKNAEHLVKNKILKLIAEKDNTKKVLIVDDESDICRLLGIHLSNEGYEVSCAYDGDSAVESVIVNKPDIVLSDLNLKSSGLSGQEVVEKIKGIDNNLPIIIVSGTTNINDINDALKAGAWDYISKPIFIWNDLIHIVKRNLEHSRLIKKSLIFNEYLNIK